jgi:hypothetical protein
MNYSWAPGSTIDRYLRNTLVGDLTPIDWHSLTEEEEQNLLETNPNTLARFFRAEQGLVEYPPSSSFPVLGPIAEHFSIPWESEIAEMDYYERIWDMIFLEYRMEYARTGGKPAAWWEEGFRSLEDWGDDADNQWLHDAGLRWEKNR